MGFDRKARGLRVSHVNGDRTDNRADNLIIKAAAAISEVKNVYALKGRWVVMITRKRVRHYLGSFGKLEDAVEARDFFLKTLVD